MKQMFFRNGPSPAGVLEDAVRERKLLAARRLRELLDKSYTLDFRNRVTVTPGRAADISWALDALEDELNA